MDIFRELLEDALTASLERSGISRTMSREELVKIAQQIRQIMDEVFKRDQALYLALINAILKKRDEIQKLRVENEKLNEEIAHLDVDEKIKQDLIRTHEIEFGQTSPIRYSPPKSPERAIRSPIRDPRPPMPESQYLISPIAYSPPRSPGRAFGRALPGVSGDLIGLEQRNRSPIRDPMPESQYLISPIAYSPPRSSGRDFGGFMPGVSEDLIGMDLRDWSPKMVPRQSPLRSTAVEDQLNTSFLGASSPVKLGPSSPIRYASSPVKWFDQNVEEVSFDLNESLPSFSDDLPSDYLPPSPVSYATQQIAPPPRASGGWPAMWPEYPEENLENETMDLNDSFLSLAEGPAYATSPRGQSSQFPYNSTAAETEVIKRRPQLPVRRTLPPPKARGGIPAAANLGTQPPRTLGAGPGASNIAAANVTIPAPRPNTIANRPPNSQVRRTLAPPKAIGKPAATNLPTQPRSIPGPAGGAGPSARNIPAPRPAGIVKPSGIPSDGRKRIGVPKTNLPGRPSSTRRR